VAAITLTANDGARQVVALPQTGRKLMVQLITAMCEGPPITSTLFKQEFGNAQAANILNMSRPLVVHEVAQKVHELGMK
jgi:hypothetical protein